MSTVQIPVLAVSSGVILASGLPSTVECGTRRLMNYEENEA